MKHTLVLIVLLTLASCNNTKNEPNTNEKPEFEVNFLEGYFPKNDIEFNAPVKTLVIRDKESFQKYFGIAQTMKNDIPEIDFENHKVIALISAPSDKKQEIAVTNTQLKKNKIQVKYKLILGKETQSFTATALKIFTIPESVYAVDFIVDRNKDKTQK
ncbi:hypothetical protein [Aequorivita marina]|uniref:hypothetical protein n=1 Tax=Aequorivita marina TaxID=3073654 RepID=UPI0028757B4A|nr:hypothetical protein [Aequorivita sp. S2608]MDS1297416.1 hypothetical protein [Aequorivita sp. S2608]